MPGAFLVNFFQFLLMALWALVFGRMIMSWVDPMGRNRASAFLYQTTEPILAPVRKILPRTGALDWSPFIVVFVIGMVLRVLL